MKETQEGASREGSGKLGESDTMKAMGRKNLWKGRDVCITFKINKLTKATKVGQE